MRTNPDVDHKRLPKALKNWQMEIAGYVGYERCVVTAGGVSLDELTPKTLESKLIAGLHFAGEVIDLDADTGGYNLQTAFSTGYLAGISAAKSL
jgi:predicted flavoprotein YhiN